MLLNWQCSCRTQCRQYGDEEPRPLSDRNLKLVDFKTTVKLFHFIAQNRHKQSNRRTCYYYQHRQMTEMTTFLLLFFSAAIIVRQNQLVASLILHERWTRNTTREDLICGPLPYEAALTVQHRLSVRLCHPSIYRKSESRNNFKCGGDTTVTRVIWTYEWMKFCFEIKVTGQGHWEWKMWKSFFVY